MKFTLIYITYPNIEEAKKIVHHLLDKKLISCANFFPVENCYWWKGKIVDSTEVVSIIKTKEQNLERIKSEVKKLHTYEIPCIIKLDAEANKEFEDWVEEETI